MVDWIIQNKVWLFSGIAVAVPIALIGWLASKRSSSTVQKQRGGKGSVNIQANGDVHLRNIGKGHGSEE